MLKKHLKWILLGVAIVAAAILGYTYWQATRHKLPKGIYSGNGRVEAKLVDVVSKEPLRVKKILVDEGDMVEPGQVLVKLDTDTLEAELAEDKAKVAAAQETEASVKATIVRQKSEVNLARIEEDRARKLLEEKAGSQREYDARKTALETANAVLEEQQAKLCTASQEIEAVLAKAATVQTRIDDATLTSPVHGRVLYRLAEVGEVLASGGKALTLVNLRDVYMEIFLPGRQAARLKIGSDARITLDSVPDVAAPGTVTFVSPEAAVHAQAGRDAKRARQADVSREDSSS